MCNHIGGHSDLLAGIVLTNSEEFITMINGLYTILGQVISFDVSWMLTRSFETLWLPVERQTQKAATAAAELAAHKNVERIFFPGHYASEDSRELREKKIVGRNCSFGGEYGKHRDVDRVPAVHDAYRHVGRGLGCLRNCREEDQN